MHKVKSGEVPHSYPHCRVRTVSSPRTDACVTMHMEHHPWEAHSSPGVQTFHLGLHFVGMIEYITKASLYITLLGSSGKQRHYQIWHFKGFDNRQIIGNLREPCPEAKGKVKFFTIHIHMKVRQARTNHRKRITDDTQVPKGADFPKQSFDTATSRLKFLKFYYKNFQTYTSLIVITQQLPYFAILASLILSFFCFNYFTES